MGAAGRIGTGTALGANGLSAIIQMLSKGQGMTPDRGQPPFMSAQNTSPLPKAPMPPMAQPMTPPQAAPQPMGMGSPPPNLMGGVKMPGQGDQPNFQSPKLSMLGKLSNVG